MSDVRQPSRRGVLQGGLVLLAASVLGPRVTLAGLGTRRADPRLVVCILRGGQDGLAVAPPIGDPDYAALRPDAGAALPLDGHFGVHPALAPLLPWWEARSLALVHAVGLPTATRSHFAGQDLLESGGAQPGDRREGLLYRALGARGQGDSAVPAVAIGGAVPLLLRGPEVRAASLDPANDRRVDPGLMERIATLWAGDPLLGPALQEAERARARCPANAAAGSSDADADADARKSLKRPGFLRTALGTGRLLAADGGYRLAVVDTGGWDTHHGQAPRMQTQLADLAGGLLALREGLGEDVWQRTIVLTVTEFGRTARPNGTGGTDHGTGGLALLAGGAVHGGRVYGDWPGLAASKLQDARDLRTATDVRRLFATVLQVHMGLEDPALARVRPLAGVV